MLITDYLIEKMEQNNIISEDKEIYIYGLNNGFTILINVLTAVMLSYVVQKETLLLFFLASFIPLRSYCGGIHCNSRLLCYIYSNMIITILLIAQDFLYLHIFIYLLITFVSIIYLFLQKTSGNNVRTLDNLEIVQYTRIKRIMLLIL